jgi:hypothetical protein
VVLAVALLQCILLLCDGSIGNYSNSHMQTHAAALLIVTAVVNQVLLSLVVTAAQQNSHCRGCAQLVRGLHLVHGLLDLAFVQHSLTCS